MVFKAHEENIYGLVVAADGYTIATCSDDKTIKSWDLRYESGSQPRLNFNKVFDVILNDVAFSPDSRFIALGCNDNSICLLSRKTGQLLQQFSVHEDAVYCVRFSPDSETLISSALDNSIFTWDISDLQNVYSPQPIKQLKLHRVGSLHQIILSELIMYSRTTCCAVK